MTNDNEPWTGASSDPSDADLNAGNDSPPAEGPHGAHEFAPQPPTEQPHHHGADPWAFDHDANQASQVWGSAQSSTPHDSGVHYTATPIHQRASKTPLVIVVVMIVVVAVVAAVVAWIFLSDQRVNLSTTPDPQTVTLSEYVDELCRVYQQVGEDSAAFETEIQDRVLSARDFETVPKEELLQFSQNMLNDVLDYARGIGMQYWKHNEAIVIDHPEGSEFRMWDRGTLTAFFRTLDDVEGDIENLSPDMTDQALGAEFERIVLEVDSLFTNAGAPSGLTADVDAEISQRGAECENPY